MMRTLLMLLKYSLAAIVVTTVGGGIGMVIGGAVLLNIPPPDSPLCGNDYLAGGGLIGAAIGLATVITLAVLENKKKRQRSVQLEKAS
ncbi:hypothetical protein [Lacipirellula limnantheis]|uniref:Uncharacterized protein n=1 Tax=Lacipirellula limnantheis TaxID=2528024 RepID=A0A517TRU3_9BACT|nr:hypothetical protein [Lacipirellula limnantheis]QDT71094.1 hypothetical protein I41_02490 [Lacipirellula limnantheis]